MLVIKNARLRGKDNLKDISISDGKIVAISEDLKPEGEVIDANGRLTIPGFVDPHLHVDKALLREVMRPNISGTLEEAVQITWDFKKNYEIEELLSRGRRVIRMAVNAGTTSMRAFADVDTIGGLTAVEALLKLKQECADMIELQIVAFPQEGLFRNPGAENLLRKAMEMGADVIGGFPWFEYLDSQSQKHTDIIFDIAKEYDADIEMLIDNAAEDPTSRDLEYLAVKTMEEGYEGRVMACHVCAISAYNDFHARRVINLAKKAGISIVANSHISLMTKNRDDHQPYPRGITRIKEMLEAGVNVLFGQDDVNDTFYPLGRADLLEVASFTAHAAHLSSPEELELIFDMATVNAAKGLRLKNYGLEVGNRADIVVLDAPDIKEALRLQPVRSYVIKSGKIVSTNEVTRKIYDQGKLVKVEKI